MFVSTKRRGDTIRVYQQKQMKGKTIMQTDKKTKISSVHFKYVGTDEQYNVFIKSVVKDYITDDSLLPDTEEEIIVVQKSA